MAYPQFQYCFGILHTMDMQYPPYVLPTSKIIRI